MTAMAQPRAVPPPVRQGAPGRSVTDLAMRMAGLCADAVDALEIAAGLEADGINDEGARAYGHGDVFSLARDLFDRSPRRPGPPEAGPEVWRGRLWRQLLRGVLFGLPGVCYVTAAPLLTRPAAGLVLVLSLLMSWTASQLVAYLGYVRLGRGDPASARMVMRRALVVAVAVVGPLTVTAGLVMGSGPAATGLAAGQCAYLLTATVALVAGAEPLLLLALLPGVGAGAVWAAGGGAVPSWVWIAWGVTVAATTALAIRCTATGTRGGRAAGAKGGSGAGAGARVSRAELTAALPYAAFGLVAGGLLTVGEVCVLLGLARPSAATTAGVLSLSLSMGGAEWLLYTYRGRAYRLLGTSPDLRTFVVGSRCLLAAVVVLYLAMLAALAAGVAWTAGITSAGLPVFTCYLGLGGAFFTALLLQSCGHVGSVLALCACALAAEVMVLAAMALSAGPLRPGPLPDPETVQAMAACGLFGVLLCYAFVALSRASCHR